ncbi:hypothetical protein [Corynebacterium xerosis]|uniref:hypothetical protein n=1 Tax=Corynebacterium xerosis TaxID=1725 RepID=UPI0013CF3119|nr:hypothetical protein [Corynebacterium xerosis]
MGEGSGVERVIAKLEGLGLKLLDRDAIHPEEIEPEFVLAAQGAQGMAFLHVLDYDAEMIEEPDAYADWVRLWARATEKTGQVSDIDSDIDFDAGTGWLTYILGGRVRRFGCAREDDWFDPDVAEENIAEFCELFPDAVRG